MQVVSRLLSCYTGSCFGDAHPADRVLTGRHPCPQLFKLKSIVVHVPLCNSQLRLESTNCKIACLPTGLVKRVVFMYLQGRYEDAIATVDTTDDDASDNDAANSSSDESYRSPINNAQIPPVTATSSITSSMTSMNEAYSFARTAFPDVSNDLSDSDDLGSASLDFKVLQDTYSLTFRKATAAKEMEVVEVKLFMVNKSPSHDSGDMKIVHVLLRDHLWVDIVVSESSPAATPLDTSEVLESHTVFQLHRCETCGDFVNVCMCEGGPSAMKPETIWRREEDIRMDECVMKMKSRHGNDLGDWHDQRPTQHQCTATCDAVLRELSLTLALASEVAQYAQFELTLTSCKRVQDLSDHVYTVFCITVCHGDLKWHISRRFRDFVQLREQLVQELPRAMDLPVLPPKTWLPTIDVKFIQERQLRLEHFLRQLSLRPDTMQSVAFLSFLGAVSSPRLEHEWISGVPRDVIHLRILHRYVETGDILLFQSKNPMSGVQRTMTGAEWDHVAMIVEAPQTEPNRPPKFLLLEATGDGVTLLPLVPRILAYNSCFINYIALRKLRMPPRHRDTFHRRMQAFVALVEGKPYSMTLNKLIRPHETNADFSGFFCSELPRRSKRRD
ncbi:hypothetical protein, variant [Aphanomyces invadans]|uniref:PX domain-containing protein n=1 Tax=Aphanomyces invadans TaxID=157072 RepID=A0A024TVV6_9STRA|nr:hypothetical protein, variant [Aphanomyces invadans]ETV97457.1 hypothetical protein, variant [Aphanomyces invadans]|eukprot:XP_008873666.1 hypothetical protein, variant [Aphanomyces invadans]